MKRTQSPEYDYVNARFRGLTQQQRNNVQQRIRTIKARTPRWMMLMAIDSMIQFELSGSAPAPTSCPDYLITGRVQQERCLGRSVIAQKGEPVSESLANDMTAALRERTLQTS